VPDVAFSFTAPQAGRYRIDTDGSGFDTLLSIRSGCGGAELACNDDIQQGVVQSRAEVDLTECQTVLIVVDGYNAESVGAVSLHINLISDPAMPGMPADTPQETACDDGVDNDGDGNADCADYDCFNAGCASDDWPADWQSFELEVLELTNQARARGANCDSEGVFGPTHPLEMDPLVREAARAHAADMAENNYFSHFSQDGRSLSDRMQATGFAGGYPWGENIAGGQTTPEQVVAGWLESDGHCSNIMSPDYRVIGVGFAFANGSPLWVQDFAGSH
jgi:uncharacterized protein YkwD